MSRLGVVMLMSSMVPRGAWARALASVHAQKRASWQARFSAAEVLRGLHVGQFVNCLWDILFFFGLEYMQDIFYMLLLYSSATVSHSRP
jgi:hypothetical protein